jgi:hypothetical protein
VAPHGRVPGLVTLGSAPLRALPRVTGAAGGSRGSRAGPGPPSVSARRSGVLAGPILAGVKPAVDDAPAGAGGTAARPDLRASRPSGQTRTGTYDPAVLRLAAPELRLGARLPSARHYLGNPNTAEQARGRQAVCLCMTALDATARFCRVECVRHKLRARSLRLRWHHRAK